ncbi:MAG TPA: DUF748 domain-containing protein, partial [Burkholderiaceae bacterium]
MNVQSLKNNQWAKRLAWVVAVVLLLWAFGWLTVPLLLRSQGEKLASEKLGRQVTMGTVEFKPWTLELTIRDLAIASADGKAAQLQIKRIYIDAELQSLLRLAPVADAVEVDQPMVRLAQTAPGHYDIDDILAKLASEPSDPQAAPQRFALYNIAIRGGAADFADQAVGRTHQLRNVELSVPFLSNLESKREVKVAPHLAFQLNGSAFDSTAVATPF